MFKSFANSTNIILTTERLTIRQINKDDASRLANYYSLNQAFLKPWEPTRDKSYFQANGWHSRLNFIVEMHKQGAACCFIILAEDKNEVLGVINFSHILRGCFYACYLGYSLAEKWQGHGIMFEALQYTIGYMQQQQKIHRIMANYMPHNYRSGNLLYRLGFEKEGFAKAYLLIDNKWQDHVLTSLITHPWLI